MKKTISLMLVFLLAATLIVSCATKGNSKQAETSEVVNVEEEITNSDAINAEPASPPVEEQEVVGTGVEPGWLTALGSISGLDVKGYRLRGEGPDGASFDWVDVTSTKVALSDIRRGQWTLYAEAIGEKGDILASGKLETFLSDSTPLGAVFLDPEVGDGDVTCSFAWSTKQVLYPSLEIYVKQGEGEYVARDMSEISMGDGVAVWTAKNMKAGSYVVRAILRDEAEAVSGVAAALRVINDKASSGSVRFIIGKLSTIYGISLENSPVNPIVGDLEIENTTIQYVTEDQNLRFDWFLNGEYVKELKDPVVDIPSLGLTKGFYRFDCIAQNENDTSINGSSILVYTEGDLLRLATPEETEIAKGDVPTGYNEIETFAPEPVVPVEEAVEAEVVAEEAVAEGVVEIAPEANEAVADTTVMTVSDEVPAPVAETPVIQPAEEDVILRLDMDEDPLAGVNTEEPLPGSVPIAGAIV